MRELTITEHARNRYHERVQSGATDQCIEFHVRTSRACTLKMLNRIKNKCESHRRLVRRSMTHTQFIYLHDFKVVFVIKVVEEGWKLVTCWRWTR